MIHKKKYIFFKKVFKSMNAAKNLHYKSHKRIFKCLIRIFFQLLRQAAANLKILLLLLQKWKKMVDVILNYIHRRWVDLMETLIP